MKSHDSYILIEQLLPIAICNVLPNQVIDVLVELCSFFRHIYGKVLSVDDLDRLQGRIVLTSCHTEMLFPPSVFTMMVHLIVHQVIEVKHRNPIHYR